MGVPPNQRLRVQEDTNVRDSNSWEYLSLNEVAEDVLLVGSANFTRNAAVHQWNDLYFMSGNEVLFDQFVDLMAGENS